MSFFEGARHTTILGGTQIAVSSGSIVNYHQASEKGHSTARRELSAAAAHTALHDSAARFNAPQCHRNTRAKYLDKLELWMLGEGDEFEGKDLIWIHGGAGAGKSAIMQSLVERNHAEALIPTLAYQLGRIFPEAMAILELVIQRDPLVFQASLHTQAYELLVRPLLHLIETGIIESTIPLRRVFIIDGLDECEDAYKQPLIIKVVTSLLCDHNVPIRFIIASRPEVAIHSAFQRETKLLAVFTSISVDDDEDAQADIRQFIEDGFLDIVSSHPLGHHITLPWPSPHSIDTIVWKSSGHFICAATVMKFIGSSSEHPGRALKVVEGLEPSRKGSPFAELDSLYMHILASATYSSQVLGILRHCCLTYFENSVEAVCSIYDISPEDVELFLFDIQSLVSLSPKQSTGVFINVKHASLGDFLNESKRSQRLYIERDEYHVSWLARYFQLLDNDIRVSGERAYPNGYAFVSSLTTAIRNSQEIGLLHDLIRRHSPRDIWKFCMDFSPADTTSCRDLKEIATIEVRTYLDAVYYSAANGDGTLFIDQFQMYIQLVLDDIRELSSAHRSSTHIVTLLCDRFNIGTSYEFHFAFLLSMGNDRYRHNGEPFRCLLRPQRQLLWSSDLAVGIELVLRQLVNLSWIPECCFPNPHERWLQQTKPLRQISLGSPRLSSHFDSYLRQLPKLPSNDTRFSGVAYSDDRASKISGRREKSFVLLTAIILYLHKSDCTSNVVELARRSLPRAALWFPKLMKRARAEMDAYVRRWDESLDGLFEGAQLLSINDMD